MRFDAGARGWFFAFPYPVLSALESPLDALAWWMRNHLADNAPMRDILGLRVAALKSDQ